MLDGEAVSVSTLVTQGRKIGPAMGEDGEITYGAKEARSKGAAAHGIAHSCDVFATAVAHGFVRADGALGTTIELRQREYAAALEYIMNYARFTADVHMVAPRHMYIHHAKPNKIGATIVAQMTPRSVSTVYRTLQLVDTHQKHAHWMTHSEIQSKHQFVFSDTNPWAVPEPHVPWPQFASYANSQFSGCAQMSSIMVDWY